jgi:hypothetical protein
MTVLLGAPKRGQAHRDTSGPSGGHRAGRDAELVSNGHRVSVCRRMG